MKIKAGVLVEVTFETPEECCWGLVVEPYDSDEDHFVRVFEGDITISVGPDQIKQIGPRLSLSK